MKKKSKIVLLNNPEQKERYYKKAKEMMEEKDPENTDFSPEENEMPCVYGPPPFLQQEALSIGQTFHVMGEDDE